MTGGKEILVHPSNIAALPCATFLCALVPRSLSERALTHSKPTSNPTDSYNSTNLHSLLTFQNPNDPTNPNNHVGGA
jgi:hypothetical protein